MRRATKPSDLFTREQMREMRRLAELGHKAPAVASQLQLPRDAVTIWLREHGLAGQRGGAPVAAPVTLPRVRFLEGDGT